MFFESDSINPNILSALELEWEERNDKSDHRPFHALSFRISGNSDFIYGNKSVHLSSGEMVFVPAHLIYTLKAQSEKLLVVHFTCREELPRDIRKFKPQNPRYYENKFSDICDAWSKKQLGYEYECKSILYKIILGIEREWNEKRFSTADDKILEAVEYIHENFTDPALNVDSVARRFGMSGTYFRKLFAIHFSEPPLKYINKLRFTLACELLQSNYYTVDEIADRCGFNNVNYFSLFIKKRTGLPPSVYRKQLLRENPNKSASDSDSSKIRKKRF